MKNAKNVSPLLLFIYLFIYLFFPATWGFRMETDTVVGSLLSPGSCWGWEAAMGKWGKRTGFGNCIKCENVSSVGIYYQEWITYENVLNIYNMEYQEWITCENAVNI